VRRLVTTEIGAVLAFAVGLMVTYVGLAVTVSGQHRFTGVLVLAAALWATLSVPLVHDQLHRERGEPAHAVWGRNERRKPAWWHTRRPD
jgi:hypothetical protein